MQLARVSVIHDQDFGLAAGYSGCLGSGIVYTASYTKDLGIERGIRNHQYLVGAPAFPDRPSP